MVAISNCTVVRRAAPVVGRLWIGAQSQQQVDVLFVESLHGVVQRRLLCVHVGTVHVDAVDEAPEDDVVGFHVIAEVVHREDDLGHGVLAVSGERKKKVN